MSTLVRLILNDRRKSRKEPTEQDENDELIRLYLDVTTAGLGYHSVKLQTAISRCISRAEYLTKNGTTKSVQSLAVRIVQSLEDYWLTLF